MPHDSVLFEWFGDRREDCKYGEVDELLRKQEEVNNTPATEYNTKSRYRIRFLILFYIVGIIKKTLFERKFRSVESLINQVKELIVSINYPWRRKEHI